MKKLIKLSVIGILFILLGTSCAKKRDGIWDDNIKLSQKKVEISADNNSILITTEGESWWITNIKLNETYIDFNDINTTQSDF